MAFFGDKAATAEDAGLWRRICAGFSGGAGVLFTGSLAGRLIGLATMPLITRLYSPADFGLLAVFSATVMVLSPALAFRLEEGVPLLRRDETAFALLAGSAMIALLNAVLLTGALWFGIEVLGDRAPSIAQLGRWLWLVPPALVLLFAYTALAHWAARRCDYGLLARTRIAQAFAGAGVKIGLGVLGIQPLGLLIGQIAGQSAGIGRSLRRYGMEFATLRAGVGVRRVRAALGASRAFAIYRFPADLVLYASMQALVLVIALRFDPATVGQVGLAVMVITVPVNLIGGSLARAYQAEAAARHRARSGFSDLTRRYAWRGFVAALPVAIGIMALAPVLFGRVFGPEWSLSGQISAMIAIHLLTQFPASAIVALLTVTGRQRLFLWFQVQRALLVLGALGSAVALDLGLQDMVLIYALVLLGHYAVLLAALLRIGRA